MCNRRERIHEVMRGASEDMDKKYRSAFTYAKYNDLDGMGYKQSKRYSTQNITGCSRYSCIKEIDIGLQKESQSAYAIALETVFIGLALLLFLLTFPLSLFFSLKFVGDFERLVVLRLGRVWRTRGPGVTLILPCIDNYTLVDVRITAFNVPPMQVITVDSGLIELGATIFLQVRDPFAAVCMVRERSYSTRVLSTATLHRLVCKQLVRDIVTNIGKQQLAMDLQVELGSLTAKWGVEIMKVELTEVKVIKEGENVALATFKKVMKSELGNQILQTISTVAEEFISQQKPRSVDSMKVNDPAVSSQNISEIEMSRKALSDETVKFDVDRLLCSLSMVIDESLVSTVGHIFQINCAELGNFYIDLKNGAGSCSEGNSPVAEVTLSINRDVFFKIIRKHISPMQAYLSGEMQISGPLKVALKLSLLSDRLCCLL